MATQNQSTEVRVEKTVSPITVSAVRSGQFDKPGMIQAELRQEIETISYYPSSRITNSLNDNLFQTSDFASLSEKVYPSKETRVCWIPVPEGTTVEEVQAKLAACPQATIYRILSNKPILSDAQQASLLPNKNGVTLKHIDEYANSQVVRYGENAKDNAGNSLAFQLILDKKTAKIQYKVNAFSTTGQEDIDLRTAEVGDFYVSAELVEELEGAMTTASQRI